MSTHDPRIIAVALEDLLQEMRSWSARAGQTLASAAYVQRQAAEAAERALHRASILLDGARQDEESVSRVGSAADALLAQCEAGSATAGDTLRQAGEALRAATATLKLWEEELKKALAWLARAEARLERALDEYESARRAYEQARSELDRAQSRHQACLNDKERSNCNSEARDVDAAQEELQRAAYTLRLAEAEVVAARAEVAAARARVRCCTKAVEYAKQAVGVARAAESEAQQAVNSAERALEFAQAAGRDLLVASEKVAEEVAAAEQTLAVVRGAVSTTEEAAARLAAADGAEASAQRCARGAEHELEDKLQLLYQLNRPDLYSPAGAVQGPPGPPPGPPVVWIDEGIRFVNVADLPDPEGVSGGADFRKTTESEMRAGLRKLQEMRPVLESGAGADSDYWADYDRRQGLDFADGYQRVYDAFYGADCIKVNKDRDSYDIDNGRHRIWLAKRMGVERLPIRVVQRRRHE